MNTKEEILHCLRGRDEYISGEELSERLCVSRTAVWKAVTALREQGYEIESVTNRGYRLRSRPDVVTEEEIASGLRTSVLAKQIYYYARVGSTNEEAKRRALDGAPNGSLLIAEEQTSGKGRLGRNWTSPAGAGLWFSVLLRPDYLPERVTPLTLLAGLAVCAAVRRRTGCSAEIKWPNDVVIGGRKVCGILTEMSAEMERINFVVIGIGINVNSAVFPEELKNKATSLRMETGKPVPRAELLQDILFELEHRISRLKAEGLEPLLAEYKALCVSLNRTVGFTRNGLAMTGTAVDISPEGELIVRLESGERIPVYSGEVTVQGIYGQ